MLTDYDRSISDAVSLVLHSDVNIGTSGKRVPDTKIGFQFPPKILSDSRSGTWRDAEIRGAEPVATYATSGARTFTLNWTYIVEDYSFDVYPTTAVDSSVWTINKIKENINEIRGYFSRTRAISSSQRNLLVLFKYPWLTGSEPWTCRLTNVSVKHGDTLVGTPDRLFPLRSDVSIDMHLWTTLVTDPNANITQAVQSIHGMKHEPSPNDLWY